MRPSAIALILGLFFSASCGNGQDPRAAATPPATPDVAEVPGPDGLPGSSMLLLAACEDAAYALKFDRAEALAGKAITLHPDHPLPAIFLQMALLARIQETLDAGGRATELFARMDEASARALELAEARELAGPSARGALYLGSALGARGFSKLLQGRMFKAYKDGQAAAEKLRLALRRDPELHDAYLGLGQYDYYCGRLGGLLRFVARLKGDIPGGIARLEACARKGGYGAKAARANLARIYSLEVADFPKAYPYVREMLSRFPENPSFVRYALATAKGLGPKDPRARKLLEPVFRQWDRGWRPPSYAKLDVEKARSELRFGPGKLGPYKGG